MVWRGPTGDGLDPTYRRALRAGHTIYSRLDVIDPLQGTVLTDVPFKDGQISVVFGNRVTRTLSLTLDGSYYPTILAGGKIDATAPFAPYGNRLALYRGIQYGDGSLCYFPVFLGRIYNIRKTSRGVFTLGASDLAKDVVDAIFESPASSSPAVDDLGYVASGASEFVKLISAPGVIPGGATFGTSDPAHSALPALTWQQDRAQAQDDMAAADAMVWYTLADGSFVRRRLPWTVPGRTPQLFITDGGVDPYDPTPTFGAMGTWEHAVSGDPNAGRGVNNSVVYISERQDGTAPTGAIVRDNDPTSPTYWRGKFGRRPRVIRNQAAQTQPQCLAAATTALQSAQSAVITVDPVQVPVDGSIEQGDLVQVTLSGVTSLQVISGFEMPLRENGMMTLHFRRYAPSS